MGSYAAALLFLATCVSGGVFYCVVFMFTQDFRLSGTQTLHSQPELLLLLPGAVMALMQREAPLKHAGDGVYWNGAGCAAAT
ncbi:inner membrane protein YbjM [Pantoea ananatis]